MIGTLQKKKERMIDIAEIVLMPEKKEEVCAMCKVPIHSFECQRRVEVVKGVWLCGLCFNADSMKKLKERCLI